jgi:hypothetical protein
MNAPVAIQNELLLPSLEISGFRAFARLSLPTLGRVNLFVGPNSAGKSSLLEAVRLYAAAGSPSTLVDVLIGRDELSGRVLGFAAEEYDLLQAALDFLFHRGGDAAASGATIRPLSEDQPRLSIARGFTVRESSEAPARFTSGLSNADLIAGPVRALSIRFGSGEGRVVPLQRMADIIQEVPWQPLAPCRSVGPNGLGIAAVAELWDDIALTEREDRVLEMLRIIAPVDRLSFVGDFDGKGDRKPVVKVRGERRPVPLGTMGDGLNRVLGIALAIVNAENGFVTVDEAENGLHHGAQWGIWEAIFALANELNVQVFATTHSWDTVSAFQHAANRSPAEGMLYRLDRRADQPIVPVAYTEREAAIAAEHQIEVR